MNCSAFRRSNFLPDRLSPQFITFRIKECPICSLLSKLAKAVGSNAEYCVNSELSIEVEAMSSIQSDRERVPSQLVILMRGAKKGRSDAIAELMRQLSKYKHPKAVLKQLAKELTRTEERREEQRVAHAAAREEYRVDRFAPTHPIFRKSRAKKGARKADAFAYRAILCGGFDTNRRRH